MPVWSEGRTHPDEETLSSYVEGNLEGHQKDQVETHVASCEDCYELVTEVLRSLASDGEASGDATGQARPAPLPREKARRFGRRNLIVGSMVGLAAALLLVLRGQPSFWFGPAGRERTQSVEKLVAAAGDERFSAGRLSGGFDGRQQSRMRSGAAGTRNVPLMVAAGELQRSAQEQPTAETLHAWGVAQLVLGEIDSAISTLEAAVAEDPHLASLQSDLSAAYLTRADTSGRPDDWSRALTAAEAALRQRADHIEALFNRALALSRLTRQDEARRAWEDYLARDATSAWAQEARDERAGLGPPR